MQLGQSIALSQAFESIATSEHRYRQLVEISPDAIFIQQDNMFSFANAAGIKLLGAHKSIQILHRSIFDFFHPASQKLLKDYLANNNTAKQASFIEGKIVTIDNKTLDVEVVSSPFTYQNRPAIYLIMRDISERKQSKLQLEVQYEIARTLAESTTLHEATTQMLKIICERMRWDIGVMWAVDKKENVLQCITTWQAPTIKNNKFRKKCLSMTFEPGVSLPGEAWETISNLRRNSGGSSPRLSKSFNNIRVKNGNIFSNFL